MSAAGQRFAARHAEMLLINAPTKEFAQGLIAEVRRGALAVGRDPDDMKILQVVMIIAGSTEAKAKAKAQEIDEYYSVESALTHFGGGAGIDLGEWALDAPLAGLDAPKQPDHRNPGRSSAGLTPLPKATPQID